MTEQDATDASGLVREARTLLFARLVTLAEEVSAETAPPEVSSLAEAEQAIRGWRKIPSGTLDEIVKMYAMLVQLESAAGLTAGQAKVATAPVLQVAEALEAMVEKVRLGKSEAA
jgi:hypothetical protein